MLSAGSKNELVIKLFRVKPAANFCGRLIVLLFRAYKSGAENFSLQTKRIESEGFTFVRTTCDEIQKSGRGSNERPDVAPLAFSDSILFNAEAAHSALGRPLAATACFFRLLIMFSLTNYLLFLPAVLVITLLPGPDFAIVVKTALLSGRRQALACALGINCGVAVHTIAAILGISAVPQSSLPSSNGRVRLTSSISAFVRSLRPAVMNLMKTAPRLKLQLPPFRTPRPKRRPPPFEAGSFAIF